MKNSTSWGKNTIEEIHIHTLFYPDRLFRCITTHQYGETIKMPQVAIETWLNLHQLDIVSHSYQQTQCKRRDFNEYVSLLFRLHLSA